MQERIIKRRNQKWEEEREEKTIVLTMEEVLVEIPKYLAEG